MTYSENHHSQRWLHPCLLFSIHADQIYSRWYFNLWTIFSDCGVSALGHVNCAHDICWLCNLLRNTAINNHRVRMQMTAGRTQCSVPCKNIKIERARIFFERLRSMREYVLTMRRKKNIMIYETGALCDDLISFELHTHLPRKQILHFILLPTYKYLCFFRVNVLINHISTPYIWVLESVCLYNPNK